MFTVCPKCALTLVVTAADLRVAQGYVRCGRCSSVFNALARLTDERQAAGASGASDPASAADPGSAAAEAAGAQPPHEPAAATAETSAVASETEVIPEAALEFNPARIDVTALFVEPAPDPQWTAATGSFKAMIAANQEGAVGEQPQAPAAPAPAPPPAPPAEDAAVEVEVDAAFLARMLSGGAAHEPPPAALPAAAMPAAAMPAAAGSPPAVEVPPAGNLASLANARPPQPATPHPRPPQPATSHPRPPQAAADRPSPAARAPAPHAPGGQPAAVDTVLAPAAAGAHAIAAPADAGTTEETTTLAALARTHAWAAGTALALLLLLGQIVNHYRDRLAADTRFNHAFTSLYGAFGVKLAPAWDLRAYDVRQLGAAVDSTSNGLITVRASVKNGAHQPQPLPLLRVTLEDRFGNRIASRDVAPRFYLPPAVPASALLASGQRVDAQMGFLDPGASAVGFEIDACLPASGGAVTCANDVSGR
jgi:predicted Zn finger-like uncharacterized protein